MSVQTAPVKCPAVEEQQEADGGDGRWKVYSGSLDNLEGVERVCETASGLVFLYDFNLI